MAEILTLEEYKKRREIDGASPQRDEAIAAALLAAEDSVEQYTSRDFKTDPEIQTKEYVYDGSGILETDDFTDLISVTAESSTLRVGSYVPGPREGATFYWLDFAGAPFQSPAMGFMRNLDTYFRECSPQRRFVTVKVKATFGWPGGAPESIKQAVTWMTDEFRKSQGTQGDVQSESIADLTYVFQRQAESASLPGRIQQLLDPYRRVAL